MNYSIKNKRTYKGKGLYIGRPSFLGNPISLGKECPVCSLVHSKKGSTLPCFEKWFLTEIKQNNSFYSKAKETLENNDVLICWCSPSPCHSEILIRWVEEGFPQRQG